MCDHDDLAPMKEETLGSGGLRQAAQELQGRRAPGHFLKETQLVGH